jgi:hypothetical protein
MMSRCALQKDGASTTIDYFLGLYRIDDKYDFPEFQARIVSCFRSCMYAWLNNQATDSEEDAVALREFSGFVSEIYKLVGPGYKPDHPLVKVLLDVADDQGSASILNNNGYRQPLITMASREVAEFGRDILLHLMAKTGSSGKNEEDRFVTNELCIGAKVTCLGCDALSWRVVIDEGDEIEIWCRSCKRFMVDWPEERISDGE